MAPIGTVGASDVTVTVNCGDALHAVRGTISGVVGDVLLQNGADVISVANGSFSFPSDLATGNSYSVSVATPLSDCTLTNGSGTIAGADAVVTIACLSPLAYYFPFDGNAVDQSGNGHDGMVNGATLVADRHGNPQSAYSFDGTAWIEAVGDSLPIGASDRTLTMWIEPEHRKRHVRHRLLGTAGLHGQDVGTRVRRFRRVLGRLRRLPSRPDPAEEIPGASWPSGSPAPITSTFGSTVRRSTHDLSANPMTMASALWIGAQTTTNLAADITSHYFGALDSIRIYDRALTDAELDMVENLLP